MVAPTIGSRRRPKLSGFAAVVLVALTAAVAQSFGRFTFGVLLPAIRDDLALSNTVAGSLATVNVAGYLVGTLIVASVSSRFRLLSIMRTGMVLAVSGLSVTALSPGPGMLAAGLLLMGLGGALTWIPAPVVASAALAPERRGAAIGILASGMGAGVVFSSQLAGFVRSTLGDSSWRTVYGVQAVLGIAIVCAALVLVTHRQENPSTRSGIGGFNVLRRMAGWLPYTVAFTAFGLLYLLVVAFLTTRLEDDSGWSSSEASLAFTFLGVAMMFGGPLFVAIAQRIGPRLSLAAAFGTWAAASTIILAGQRVSTLAASVVVGLLFTAMPTLFTLYVVNNTTAEDYGPSFAAATFAFGVAQMISPQLGGFLADATGSFTLVFLLSASLALIGLATALRLPTSAD
ncbi:MAG: MFS transporter [Acidimicrobiales bacterium]